MSERQTATRIADVRADHVARYRFAAERIVGEHVVDAACGCGYGAAVLIDEGARSVVAIDRNAAALEFGDRHWSRPGIVWVQDDLDRGRQLPRADVVCSFETIEHLEDPLPFLSAASVAAPKLVASVPNEAGLPFDAARFPFHRRHYTQQEFADLLAAAGYGSIRWHGQVGPHSPVEALVDGMAETCRTLVVVAWR